MSEPFYLETGCPDRQYPDENTERIQRVRRHSVGVAMKKVNLNAVGNSNDRQSQHEAKPEAGSRGVPAKKQNAGASQISRPGQVRGHTPRLANVKRNPHQERAKGFRDRSENGNADAEGGQS